MIIVGYQGIGKSTLAQNNPEIIDLESGNFWVDGNRIDDWYKVYANIAKHLSEQGKIVFTSSHKVFRDYLKENNIKFTVICPCLSLKEKWIDKLQERYNITNKDKDYKALMNAKQMYDDNIHDLLSEDNVIELNYMNYDLGSIINSYCHK